LNQLADQLESEEYLRKSVQQPHGDHS
jgi:hypothetical protein